MIVLARAAPAFSLEPAPAALLWLPVEAEDQYTLDHLRWGVGQARRGWLEPANVLNTRALAALRRLLASTMGRRAPRAAVADARVAA